MNKIKNNLKLILSDKFMNMLMILLVGFISYKVLGSYNKAPENTTIIYGLEYVLKYTYIYFVMFMLVANQNFMKFRKSQYEELMCVNTYKSGYIAYILALNLLNIIASFIIIAVTMISALRYDNFSGQYAWYLIRILILYYFLPGVLAILIGVVVSAFNKRIVAVIIMLAIACIMSPISYENANISTLLFEHSYLVDMLRIIPRDFNDMLNPVVYYLIDLNKWSMIIILIIIMSIFVINIYIKNKRLIYNIVAVFFLCINLLIYNQEYSSATEDYEKKHSVLYQYEDEHWEEQNFDITEYVMDIKLRNVLSVDCTMTVSDNALDEYTFTLYHTFKISKIYDQNNNELKYDRDLDFVKVYANDNNIEKIRITYRGIPSCYYAGREAVYISGTFPYYPYAGKHSVYRKITYGESVTLPPIDTGDPEIDKIINESRGEYQRKIPYYGISKTPNKAKFTVNIDALIDIYSNLNRIKHNSFEGVANNMFIMGGFLKEKQVDDVTFVYPYLSCYADYNDEELLRNIIKECESIEAKYDTDYTVHGKKVFIHNYYYHVADGISRYFDDYLEIYGSVEPEKYKDFLKKRQEEEKNQ